jgi:AbrB family looped-hinge helix DNA binding protein
MTHPLSIEASVDVVTISPKFQVVIPRTVRERLNLSPGQKVQALVYDGRVELIPLRPAKALRGFLRGIDTTVARDVDRG